MPLLLKGKSSASPTALPMGRESQAHQCQCLMLTRIANAAFLPISVRVLWLAGEASRGLNHKEQQVAGKGGVSIGRHGLSKKQAIRRALRGVKTARGMTDALVMGFKASTNLLQYNHTCREK